MERKYELTEETLHLKTNLKTTVLYRIKALRDFSDVKKGDLGGFVESEKNLSHEGNCWVSGDSKVYSDARVIDDALVGGAMSKIWNSSIISGTAVIKDSTIYEYARVSDSAVVMDSVLRGDAKVFQKSLVVKSIISGHAKIYGKAIVTTGSNVRGHVQIYGYSQICNSSISKNAIIIDSRITGASVGKDAYITSSKDIITISRMNGRDNVSFYRTKNNRSVAVSCGKTFCKTLDEFAEEIKSWEDNEKELYIDVIAIIKKKIFK